MLNNKKSEQKCRLSGKSVVQYTYMRKKETREEEICLIVNIVKL